MSFCDHCFHIQVATRDDDKLTFRLFSDYAGNGDLDDMIKLYYTEEHSDKQIPEPFVWMVFHAVAEGIYAMNTRRCGEKRTKIKRSRSTKPVWNQRLRRKNVTTSVRQHSPGRSLSCT
jgi:hypothetical protein